MFLGSKGGAERDYHLAQDSVVIGHLGPLFQDVTDLLGVVGREDQFLLSQGTLDSRVQELRELQVIGHPDHADLGLLEVRVDPGEVVEDVVPFLD